MADLEFKQL